MGKRETEQMDEGEGQTQEVPETAAANAICDV
jgi:hypothetical protein